MQSRDSIVISKLINYDLKIRMIIFARKPEAVAARIFYSLNTVTSINCIRQTYSHISYVYIHMYIYDYIRQTCDFIIYCNLTESCRHLPYGSSSRQSIRSEWPVGFFVPMISLPLCSSSRPKLTHCPVVS